jgi:hypothetical protein
MRGLRTDRTAQVIIAGLAFVQNLRRGHYELATETPRRLRVADAFNELAVRNLDRHGISLSADPETQQPRGRYPPQCSERRAKRAVRYLIV